MKTEINSPAGYEFVGDVPRTVVNDNGTLVVVFDIRPIEQPQPQPDPHAALKEQYARDVETCATIPDLEAWQLWQCKGVTYKEFETSNCHIEHWFADVQYRRHPHADKIIEFHKDTPEMRKRWQQKGGAINNWLNWADCGDKPSWNDAKDFRRKPRVITLPDRTELPAPLNAAPAVGSVYWIIQQSMEKFIAQQLCWNNDRCDNDILKNSHAFANEQDCKSVADYFNSVLRSAE